MLNNKYDFYVVFSVENANPNGDPINGNRPRMNFNGVGEVSDVCLKRKIRNRWMQMGKNVFVQSDDNKLDEYPSLKARAEGMLKKETFKSKELMKEISCKTWLDVRAFGQVFAFKGDAKDGVSVGIRGPVSLHSAFSVDGINITSIQITKSVNSEGNGDKKGSDTMGMKHRVDFGVYAFAGSINPQLASVTGFDDSDAEDLKQALISLFENDASSARPEGSMEVIQVIWWKHNNQSGQYSSAKVHKSVSVKLKEGIVAPEKNLDYEIHIEKLDELSCEVFQGR